MNGTKLYKKTGTEGSSYDPWHYEELTVERHGKSITIHIGLAEWIEINGKRIESNEYNGFLSDLFKEETGMTMQEFDKYYERIKYTCKKCNNRDLYCESGFPGETLYICSHCHEIVTGEVDIEAI